MLSDVQLFDINIIEKQTRIRTSWRNCFLRRLYTGIIRASSRACVTALILVLMYLFDRLTLLINVRTMI